MKTGKLKKTNSSSFRLGVAAFVLGIGCGYSISDDRTPAVQIVALGERVKTVLFVKTADAEKEG
ncbi:MAG TPA: hypothetical protein VEQ34_06825 [Pyrinomonadaceae bacterium]|nr:hypothetical protein [Pyrinomonadaceae bacterium]